MFYDEVLHMVHQFRCSGVLKNTQRMLLILFLLLQLISQEVVMPSQVSFDQPNDCWINQDVQQIRLYSCMKDEELEFILFFCALTYVYKHLPATPYVLFLGPPGIGKSNTLILISSISFNSTYVSYSSHAAMRRIITNLRGLFIIDDWRNQKNRIMDDILLSGYKRLGGKSYIGAVHNQKKVVSYVSYCPKMIASNEPIHNPALRDRFIPINIEKAPVNMKQPGREWDATAKLIKSHLIRFIRENRQRIIDTYDIYQPIGIPPGRCIELWKPILTIAKVADEAYNNGVEVFYLHMLHMAKAQVEKARRDETIENPNTSLIMLLNQYLSECRPDRDIFYRLDKIQDFLLQQDRIKFRHWTTEYLSRRMNMLGIIADVKRIRFIDGRVGEERRSHPTCVAVDMAKLQVLVGQYSL